MKTLQALALAFLFSVCAFAQTNALTQTTLSAAAGATDNFFTVTSATGINAPSGTTVGSMLYVISPGNPRGETAMVVSVVSTRINVRRGLQGARTQIPSGALVLIGQPNWFYNYDPSGGCTTASTYVGPWVNTKTGSQWLCSTITLSWVPGWGNTISPPGVTTLVASAAGSVVPSGPLFHVSGTSAITGFTLASMIGFPSTGCFTIIPDAIFTWTAAGDIAVAGTAVVNKALPFCFDNTNSKFVPGYIA